MRPYFLSLALLATPLAAQESGPNCQAIIDGIIAEYPTDYQSCPTTLEFKELDECTPPQTFSGTGPTSHLLLAIDASGSMAGNGGSDSKMNIAKREALNFLTEIPKEVRVGLVVYGHKGSNKEADKALSCASSELVHDFGPSRRKLKDTIEDLRPVGWTPLGGVLEYADGVLSGLKPPREGELRPVVYVISDGKETCEGDPVAAAKSLFESGIQTTVNTIGFDVDAETAAQLQAIAEAAGGTYYPARDGKALRSQLDAIRETEASMARYQYCVDLNLGKIAVPYHNARVALAGCWQRNDPNRPRTALLNFANKARRENLPEAACSEAISDHALDMEVDNLFVSRHFDAWGEEERRKLDEYRARMQLQ